MKNFTNNFKQFTSRLSARWLIMALMLLVGTSSAWAATIYFDNSNTQWSKINLCVGKSSWSEMNISMTHVCGNIYKADVGTWDATELSFYDATNYTSGWGSESGSISHRYGWLDYPATALKTGIGGNISNANNKVYTALLETTTVTTGNNDKKSKTVFKLSSTVIDYSQSLCCTKSVSYGTGSYNNGEITLSATYNTCGNAYIGFQWKEENDSWCYDNNADCYVMLGEQNKSNEEVTTTLTKTGGVFVFRPYIVVGNNAQDWIYGDEFEVITCSDPSAGYSISNENASVDWDGTEKEVIITTANGYATPSKIYYDGNETKPTAVGEYTITIDVPSYGTYCAATDLEIGTFTITCPSIAAPALITPDPVCAGTQVTLSNYNGVNSNTVKWYSNSGCTNDATTVAPENNSTYYAKAYDEASGCYSSEYSTLTFTVNPLPTINIGENVTAVKFEDVVLTATGNNIADVTWTADKGTITKDATDPKKAVLTYDQTGTVTVTATATSAAGCTSVAATKTVTFSAEDCNSTTRNDLIITCNPNGYYGDVYLHIWPNGEGSLTGWPGYKGEWKDNVWRWEISASLLSTSKQYDIIFNNNAGAQTQDLDHNLIPGNQYNYTLNYTNWGDGNNRPTMGTVDPIPLSQPATITAPAAKTISVSTTDGEGNIIFSGQVVKTGCDATNEYGFQYSSDEQTWTTVKVGENAAAGTAISNNTVNGLDGTYYVRAYITNDNSTQYGAIKEITVSTEKDPITTVTLTHVKDVNGTAYTVQELENLIYCVGETVWFELTYVGSKFIPENNVGFKWTTYPGNDLIGPYNGNKYKFTITGPGTIGISLRNEENVDDEGNPTWVESNPLGFNTRPEPTAPTIRLSPATICSNSLTGASLTLSETVEGQAYELWKYANDDDTEGSKVANVATLNCTENNQALEFSGIKAAGKYFVKTYYTTFCNTVTANSSYATLTVVKAEDVSISINPITATTTPWMPVKLTISATDDYTLEVPDGVEFSQNGDICSVKIPLPDGATGGEGQYENVSFPQNAITSYTVTANLVSTGGENNPCAVPATATITLIPYVEECTEGH